MFNNGLRDVGAPSKPSRKGILGTIKAYISRDKLGELLVISGCISAQDLKFALNLQKKSRLPLGQILIAQNCISIYQLRSILFRQQALRFFAAVCLCAVTMTGFSKKSSAGEMEYSPEKISFISVLGSNVSFEGLARAPLLFGAEEKKSENIKAFTKWIGMFDKFEKTMASNSSQKVIKAMQVELAEYKSNSIYTMAEKVNAMMNRKKYILDQKNWGKSDYWATPIEFMVRGGDCEDFAIAKYVALRALGVPESRLRVAIVQDMKKNIPHAILVVYAETGPVILDNQSKVILSASSIAHYKPIYSINRNAWWLHTAPEATIVASAR